MAKGGVMQIEAAAESRDELGEKGYEGRASFSVPVVH
jgi:hypothetical protein